MFKQWSQRREEKALRRREKRERRGRHKDLRRIYGYIVDEMDERDLRYVRDVISVFKRLPSSLEVIYDIGAFNGASAEAFAIVSSAQVYAFEPMTEMQEQIKLRMRRTPEIHLIPTALGNQEGQREIYCNQSKLAATSMLDQTKEFVSYWPDFGETRPEMVTINRLDDQVREGKLPAPDLIKMDVQGMEHDVMSGGEVTFASTRYIWVEMNFGEYFKGGSTFDSLYINLKQKGFELIDLIDLIRDKKNDRLLYLDGIFENTKLTSS